MNRLRYYAIPLLFTISTLFSSCGQNVNNEKVDAAALLESYSKRLASLVISIESSSNAPDLRQSAVQDLVELTDSCVDLMRGSPPPADHQNVHRSAMKVYETVKTELVPLARSLSQIERPEQEVPDYTRKAAQYNASYAKIEALTGQALEQAVQARD